MLDDIPSGRAVSIERETFPGLLARDGRLFALPSPAYWLDIGTPAKYLEANADRLERSGARLPPRAGRHVAPGAAVDGSVLGAGAVVEAGAKVLRSVALRRRPGRRRRRGDRLGPGRRGGGRGRGGRVRA